LIRSTKTLKTQKKQTDLMQKIPIWTYLSREENSAFKEIDFEH
jgi:hypothetical protein